MRTIHRDIVGPFIISSDNQLLLGKSRKGGVYKDQWMIPGGGVESGETRLEAVIRETIEEVGIDISTFVVKQLEETSTGQSEKVLSDTGEKVTVNMTFNNFVVRTGMPASKLTIRCDDDLTEAAWFPISGLAELNISPPTKAVLQTLGCL